MAYIGRGLDKISNIEKLDVITFDGSQSYTLQKNSTNFVPVSANNLIVSIDGVVQAGNFTVSGSTIDFGVAVPSTSTCDFIKHFGTGVAFTPADGTVSSAQLGTGAITGQTALAESPASDDQFLIYDTSATSFKKLAASYVGGTNTPIFYGELASDTSALTRGVDTKVTGMTANELDTDTAFDGTKFTVPSGKAGKYYIEAVIQANYLSSSQQGEGSTVRIYKNGSSVKSGNLIKNSGGTNYSDVREVTIRATSILDLSATDYIEMYGNLFSYASTGICKATNTYIFGYKLVE